MVFGVLGPVEARGSGGSRPHWSPVALVVHLCCHTEKG